MTKGIDFYITLWYTYYIGTVIQFFNPNLTLLGSHGDTMNDYYKYSISQHFISAIANDDRTGLDDDEEQALNEFLASLPTAEGTWDFEDDASFTWCDIIDMYSECVCAKLHFHNTNI